MCLSSPVRSLKLHLTAEQSSTGECWIPPKKIPQGQRRRPRKMVGGAQSHLESNPIPARDALRAQTNLVRTRTQIETELYLTISHESTGQQWTATWTGALATADLGVA